MFPTLWTKLDAVIAAGEIITSEEVYLEIKRKSDDLHDWIQARKQMLVPLDKSIQVRATALLGEFPRLVDTLRGRGKADPFVLATAIERNAVVVTGEVVTGKMEKPRIPDVCQVKGIRWMNFLQMIRELKITF